VRPGRFHIRKVWRYRLAVQRAKTARREGRSFVALIDIEERKIDIEIGRPFRGKRSSRPLIRQINRGRNRFRYRVRYA
jgi:hypothetical protein